MIRQKIERARNIAILATTTIVIVGAVVVVHKIRRRRSHFLPKATRKVLEELVGMDAEGLVTTGVGGKVESAFEHRLGRLTDKQLIAVYAAVHVGSFIKHSDLNPLHPDPAAFAQAVHEYTKAELAAPETRKALLTALSDMGPIIVKTALRAALDMLG